MSEISEWSVNDNSTEVFGRLSDLISQFTTDPATNGEMLPKTSAELAAVFANNESLIYVDEEGNPVAHAAAWPLLISPNLNISLYEFGSWFVVPQMRHLRPNGLTIGEQVAAGLINRLTAANLDNGQQTAFLATVKRLNSARGLNRVGFDRLRFSQFPMVTALTCTCRATSEHWQDQTCQHRRRNGFGESASGELTELFLPDGDLSRKIPCTLMGTVDLLGVENELAKLYREWQGEPFTDQTITVASMRNIASFYQQLGISL